MTISIHTTTPRTFGAARSGKTIWLEITQAGNAVTIFFDPEKPWLMDQELLALEQTVHKVREHIEGWHAEQATTNEAGHP